MCGARSGLAGFIAPKVTFLGLFSETLEAGAMRPLRGHA